MIRVILTGRLFLLISISLIVTGCSDAPKEPLSVNDQVPVRSANKASYVYHPYVLSANINSKQHQRTKILSGAITVVIFITRN